MSRKTLIDFVLPLLGLGFFVGLLIAAFINTTRPITLREWEQIMIGHEQTFLRDCIETSAYEECQSRWQQYYERRLAMALQTNPEMFELN